MDVKPVAAELFVIAALMVMLELEVIVNVEFSDQETALETVTVPASAQATAPAAFVSIVTFPILRFATRPAALIVAGVAHPPG